MLSLTSLSIAHPTVPSARRAELSLPGRLLNRAHERLEAKNLNAFLLSTCLRIEIAWLGGSETLGEHLGAIYGDDTLPQGGAVRTGEAAFCHLCRVAAGLDSPFIGEPEVLIQFRQAVSVWREASVAANGLGRALEAAVAVARSTRRRLGDAPRGSLASVAAGIVAPHGSVAILGGGAMARAAVEHLDGVDTTVFARRDSEVGGTTPRPWDQAAEALATYPAVIAAVPGKEGVFTQEQIAGSLGKRSEPLLLIDLGMPPAFNRRDIDDTVQYIGVDDLAAAAKERSPLTADGDIDDEAGVVWARLSVPGRAGQLIAAILEQAETAVTEEVKRESHRLIDADDAERVLRRLAHRVVRRVLHPPISFIGSAEHGEDTVAALAEAFGVEDG